MKLLEGWDIELLKKIKNSITTQIFITTLILLILISGITYIFIGVTMPASYRTELDNDLEKQIFQLIDQLQKTTLNESSSIFDKFLIKNKATLFIRMPDGRLLLPPSNIFTENDSSDYIATIEENDQTVFTDSQTASTNLYDLSSSREYSFSFADSDKKYILIVIGEVTAINQVTTTLLMILPWILVTIICISLFAAFLYSHYITKPILAISTISKKMSNMELDCRCDEGRFDEIGILAKSLNEMAQNLSKALNQLETANNSLKQDIDKERELDKQRMMFFSAISHELKTPITALQGQLEGMLQNYGDYKDRDKYLSRSLTITKSMEHIIQEIIFISRLDASDFSLNTRKYDFSEQIREVIAGYIDLIEQKQLDLSINIAEKIIINADCNLIEKVLSNLLSNAVQYSPTGEKISVTSSVENKLIHFSIYNSGIQISEEALPHLFESFYRTDGSRSRQTGGSGLGLYLVKRILEQHSAEFCIRNITSGVEFSFLI